MKLTNKGVIRAGVLLIASGMCQTMWGQFSSSIEGTVTDTSAAAIPGATMTVTNEATGIKLTTQTNGAGYFLFPSLPAGMFSLTATGNGFKTNDLTGVRLETGARRTANITLEVGAQATVLNVKAEVAAVELSDAKVSGVIDSRQLAQLPIPGRNYMALVNLTPGVTGTIANPDIFQAEAQVNVNAGGLRGEQNGFAVDGGTTTSMVRHGRANLQPNAESIEEVQITVNNFSAAAGNDAGAAVKVTTKSGTNEFHGSASWFHNDNVLNSRSIFQNTVNATTGRVLPVSRKNEAAGSFGGPVIKNRTFLFASFDILRQGTAPTGVTTVETPELVNFMNQVRPNNKSTFLLKTYPAAFTPYTNLRTAGSVLGTNCATLASPSTPIPSAIGNIPCNLNIIGDGVTPILTVRNGKQWSLRGDHQITDKDRFYANVFRDGEEFTTGNTTRSQFLYPQVNLNWLGNVNETHTFSSRLLNEIRVNAVRVHGEIQCVECQIPTITVTSGINGFGIGGPTPFFQNNYELQDTLTWIKGNHNVKAGFGITRLQANWKPTAGYQRPSFGFSTMFDFLNDNPATEGNLGINPKDGSVYTPDAAEREHTENAFVDDTWKVRPNLTVTVGLRWEAYGLINQTTLGNNVQFLSGNDTTSRIADGKNVTQFHILDHGDWNNFAPRLNFAWDPKGDGKTSIRGGAGIFYDYLPSQLYGGGHFTAPLFFITSLSAQTTVQPLYAFGASKSDPYNFPRPAGVQGILTLDVHNGNTTVRPSNSWVDPSLKNSYTESFFFGVQRALTSTLTLEANSIVNLGRHIYSKYDVNRFPGDLIQNNGIAKRLNPSFGSIAYAQANMTSSYTGGNVTLRQRYSHGLQFQAAWTFGHAIDMADSFSASASDWWNLKLEKGTAGFNANHKLALSGVWDVPAVPGSSALLKTITGGWQLSGLTILQSGSPFSVSCGTIFTPVRDASGKIIGNSGCDFNADTATGDRPNAPVFGSNINMDKQVLLTGTFKASDFPKPALGQLGTLGRNTFVNPGYANTDLAVLRNFKASVFTEKLNIQFRAEAFNAFNRVNLGGIQGAMENTNFGKVTGINGSPRRFQFGLRLSF